MSCDKPLGPFSAVLASYSTAVRFEPMTRFVPLLGIQGVDAALQFVNVVPNGQAMPYYQLATTRPDDASAPVAFAGSPQNAGSKWWKAGSMGSAAYWVRFGVGYSSTSTSFGQVDVKAYFATNGCNRSFGAGRVLVNPGEFSNTSYVGYFPVGKWVPACGLQHAQAAFVWSGLLTTPGTNQVDYQLAMRTAIDPSAPDPWVDLEGGFQTTAANVANVSRTSSKIGLTSPLPAIATSMWCQLGVAIRKSSGANAPRGELWVTGVASDV